MVVVIMYVDIKLIVNESDMMLKLNQLFKEILQCYCFLHMRIQQAISRVRELQQDMQDKTFFFLMTAAHEDTSSMLLC